MTISLIHEPPPLGAVNEDRGPVIIGILWGETAVAAVFVVLRFLGRSMIRNIWWDDWLMLLTLALYTGGTILVTLQAAIGGYRHIYFLTEEAAQWALELNFILRGVHILSLASGKASIGVQILRLLGRQHKWQKWLVWGIISFTVLVNVLNCILNFAQCIPVEANWNPQLRPHANCFPKRAQLGFAYFMSSENILCDAVLAVVPATFLWGLNMSRKRRISLSVLLGLGSMAMICGIVKSTELHNIANDPDFTWAEFALTIWALSEVFVIIMCGTIPALKPIWDRYILKKPRDDSSQRNQSWIGSHLMKPLNSISSKTFRFDQISSPGTSSHDHEWSQGTIRATTQIQITNSSDSRKNSVANHLEIV